MSVEMKIKGLMVDPVSNMPIIVLKDSAGEAVLPIWVGIFEANAIAMELENVISPRPMTHDLLKNVIEGLKAEISRVVITDLKENTFFATIHLGKSGEALQVDARPSDAMALALLAEDLEELAVPTADREHAPLGAVALENLTCKVRDVALEELREVQGVLVGARLLGRVLDKAAARAQSWSSRSPREHASASSFVRPIGADVGRDGRRAHELAGVGGSAGGAR